MGDLYSISSIHMKNEHLAVRWSRYDVKMDVKHGNGWLSEWQFTSRMMCV